MKCARRLLLNRFMRNKVGQGRVSLGKIYKIIKLYFFYANNIQSTMYSYYLRLVASYSQLSAIICSYLVLFAVIHSYQQLCAVIGSYLQLFGLSAHELNNQKLSVVRMKSRRHQCHVQAASCRTCALFALVQVRPPFLCIVINLLSTPKTNL